MKPLILALVLSAIAAPVYDREPQAGFDPHSIACAIAMEAPTDSNLEACYHEPVTLEPVNLDTLAD